jgi:hypothetical protein
MDCQAGSKLGLRYREQHLSGVAAPLCRNFSNSGVQHLEIGLHNSVSFDFAEGERMPR